ncbi:glycosyltransferase family 2 protein [Cellulomonas sp. SG140]|uniref:glycosyltransferase family 2 protein n=1 Tax=Cellulomonas sp. SG140 TaxID=2976536 RepID=UPI0021E7B73D|nr:glycosyltransferase family A protein [Cellulomonas sp. SG140]
MPSPAPDLSVVIPSYQSEPYLPSTLAACAAALARTSWRAEVVVVDDGSTDGTDSLVRELAGSFPVPLHLVRQSNKGRFLARWAGMQEATGRLVLLLDSRVLLDRDALVTVETAMAADPALTVWNGHAVTDPQAPLVGHFWEVPVHVFWGGWLGNPRPVSFGIQDYNRYPKGTGVFLAPREVLIEACREAWPTGDAALASDDTKVIRGIAASTPIHLDPGFRAVYRPRTSTSAFVRHSLGRGTFLVDSFGGVSVGWSAALVGLGVAPLVALALLWWLAAAGAWAVIGWLAVAGLLAVLAPAAVAAAHGCSRRGVAAYVAYLPVFVLPYWLGLLRGLLVHRGALVVGAGTVAR